MNVTRQGQFRCIAGAMVKRPSQAHLISGIKLRMECIEFARPLRTRYLAGQDVRDILLLLQKTRAEGVHGPRWFSYILERARDREAWTKPWFLRDAKGGHRLSLWHAIREVQHPGSGGAPFLRAAMPAISASFPSE